MKILIVAATHFEVLPILEIIGITEPTYALNIGKKPIHQHQVDVLITGVGMVNTAMMLSKHNVAHYDMFINAGVAGAFNKQIQLGDVVQITEDILSEMGAEDGEEFISYDQLGLPGKHCFKNPNLLASTLTLPTAKGITVNTIHGNAVSIQKIEALYQPDVESMEGAAFFATLENTTARYFQIRSISNYVEKRNKANWKMELAITQLNQCLIQIIGVMDIF